MHGAAANESVFSQKLEACLGIVTSTLSIAVLLDRSHPARRPTTQSLVGRQGSESWGAPDRRAAQDEEARGGAAEVPGGCAGG